MTEIRFYHLEQRRVDQALPSLLERALEEGRRVLVRASSEEMVAALNERLWTYDDASFLPHGAADDGDPMEQPIFLTSELENPNAATMLVQLSGAEASEADDAFDLVVLMFDGRDEMALPMRGANGGASRTSAARSATGARAMRAAGSRRGKFGFSWPLTVSEPISLFLEVGFPWNSLDSLVRNETYQWVTRDFR